MDIKTFKKESAPKNPLNFYLPTRSSMYQDRAPPKIDMAILKKI